MWVPDSINNQMLVYDNTGNDDWKLDRAKTIKLAHASNWITMGLGRKDRPVFVRRRDVKAHKIVAHLKDEYGNLIHSEKFLELAFDNKAHLMRTVNQFAEGDPAAVEARRASLDGQTKVRQAQN